MSSLLAGSAPLSEEPWLLASSVPVPHYRDISNYLCGPCGWSSHLLRASLIGPRHLDYPVLGRREDPFTSSLRDLTLPSILEKFSELHKTTESGFSNPMSVIPKKGQDTQDNLLTLYNWSQSSSRIVKFPPLDIVLPCLQDPAEGQLLPHQGTWPITAHPDRLYLPPSLTIDITHSTFLTERLDPRVSSIHINWPLQLAFSMMGDLECQAPQMLLLWDTC